MKNICKITALLAAVLMLFCLTGCGDTAGGSPSSGTQPQTQTPSGGTQTQTPAEPQFVALETPLTLEAIEAGTITLCDPGKVYNLKYKKNGGDFVSVTENPTNISVDAGDKVAFYADGSSSQSGDHFQIQCNHDCFVYGNVMSLLNSSTFTNVNSVTQYAFSGLFSYNTHIKNHSSKTLVLPATTLAVSCYYRMFDHCTGLTSAPALPATALESYCYGYMFRDCTGLTSAPALPATTLENKNNCYYEMFKGCTNLASVTCLATNISATNCTSNWLSGVASSGTFTKAASMDDWPTNSASINNGIPAGWTVQD